MPTVVAEHWHMLWCKCHSGVLRHVHAAQPCALDRPILVAYSVCPQLYSPNLRSHQSIPPAHCICRLPLSPATVDCSRALAVKLFGFCYPNRLLAGPRACAHWAMGGRLLHLQQRGLAAQLLRGRRGDHHVPPGPPHVPARLPGLPIPRLPHRQGAPALDVQCSSCHDSSSCRFLSLFACLHGGNLKMMHKQWPAAFLHSHGCCRVERHTEPAFI